VQDDEPCGPTGDADLIRTAAARLREDADRARHLGLAHEDDLHVVTALLELIAVELPHLRPGVRREIVEFCRGVLGMDRPTSRTVGRRGPATRPGRPPTSCSPTATRRRSRLT
jgi:hypothetical protein